MLAGLILFHRGEAPNPPPFEMYFCFGEDWPDRKPKEKKLIMVQVCYLRKLYVSNKNSFVITPRPQTGVYYECHASFCVEVVPVVARMLTEMFSGELSWSTDSIRLQISNPDVKDQTVEQFKVIQRLLQDQNIQGPWTPIMP